MSDYLTPKEACDILGISGKASNEYWRHWTLHAKHGLTKIPGSGRWNGYKYLRSEVIAKKKQLDKEAYQ